jgi:diacylglycerol kinase family enzyme
MRGVPTFQVPCLELSGDALIEIDGELSGRAPAHLEIVPDALTLLMPAAYR